MERSADVLAAGLLEVSDPSLSSKFFLRQVGLSNYAYLLLLQCDTWMLSISFMKYISYLFNIIVWMCVCVFHFIIAY